MPTKTNPNLPPANRLLAALPVKEYRTLLPEMTEVTLTFGATIYEPGNTIQHVYFPNNSIISLLSKVTAHSTLEVGMVGNEGMAGLSVFMGIDKASTRGIVQGEGSAMRMKSATLRQLTNKPSSLRTLLHGYTHSLFTQISQSSVCNRFHRTDTRLARWLLMTGDRMGSNEFRLTQDFLSQMVGVRREAINKAAGALQKHKLINYRRGTIAILNRPGLVAASCSCYAFIKETENFLD
ncbi:MAG: Crp/Fnr family transcriptional regulator [Pyrinomonadaceae bacterium]|nr:Crp/Fnr family transcriptional regulator [Pyrinomonadaceae bacterium]